MRGLHKRKGKKAICSLLAAAMLLVFAGCGAASNSGSAADSAPQEAAVAMNTMSYDRSAGLAQESVAAEAPETEMAGAEAASGTGSVQVQEAQSQRKLIKTVEMDIETKEFDNVLSALESEVAALGGYIENSNTYNGSSYSSHRETRWADMTVRIPEEELDSFLNTVSDISNVTRRSDNVEDVTLAYVDLESHRDALRTEQTRLLELLEQAETIEDIITIESRLSEVRYQLESMESQLRTYDNKIDYSTVYLNISEVEVFTPVSEETVWERIANGFMGSLENIGVGLREFFIGLMIHLPYLILAAAFAAVLAFIIIKSRKRSERKKGAQAKETHVQENRGQEQEQTLQKKE